MQEEHQAAAPVADIPLSDAKREMSTIEFPYGDLDDAVRFARAVHEVGGQSCSIDQIAGYLKQSPKSGAFRLRSSYPRVFGLTQTDRGSIVLTPLGMRIIDATQEKAARAEAFLFVPLYRAIYEKYKGYQLPPPAALEREMNKLGVSSKQTDKARQAFDRSARQAGFMWAGTDRLVAPVLKDGEASTDQASTPATKPLEQGSPGAEEGGRRKGGGGGGREPPDRDELMKMLLRFLPEEMDNERLARWLRAAEVNLRMAYDIDGGIKITTENHPRSADPS